MKGREKPYFFDQDFFFFNILYLVPGGRGEGCELFQVGAESPSLSNEPGEFMNWSYKSRSEGFLVYLHLYFIGGNKVDHEAVLCPVH